MKIAHLNLLLVLVITLLVAGCGGGGGSDSEGGGGEVESKTVLVGPDLNGSEWSGYYKSVNGHYASMTASIQHSGNWVTIQTSLQSGVASRLEGTIDSIGNMTMIDTYDNEDWTTYYGAVSSNSINLADKVFEDNHESDINIIILKR